MLNDFLAAASRDTEEYFKKTDVSCYGPEEVGRAAFLYYKRGGKRLRPALLLMCAKMFGGERAYKNAIPAALAVELFHTFTLIHDDIIDNDDFRRGGPSAHKSVSQIYSSDEYGVDTAILAGDVLHGFSVSLLCEAGADRGVVLSLVSYLERQCLGSLIDGEATDTRHGVLFSPALADSLTVDDALSVIRGKTSRLFEFCVLAGASIGKNKFDLCDAQVTALMKFASCAGIAFQLTDDILGLMGDGKKLGKPIGSDIREGKITPLVIYALSLADEEQKRFLLSVLGNNSVDNARIKQAVEIIAECGAVQKANSLAAEYMSAAALSLESLPEGGEKALLYQWLEHIQNREF